LHELVPPTIGGIATDVIERRYQRAGGGEGNELAARAVLSPGLSLGNPKARAGTLGLIVFEKETPVVLSCHHVLAGQFAEVGDPILQPPVEAGGAVPKDVVGKLKRFFPPGPAGDAAIADIDPAHLSNPSIPGSDVVLHATGTAFVGLELEKVGATTGTTRGIVEGVGGHYRILPEGYVIPGFQIGRTANDGGDLSLPGDSGAVWYHRAAAVGFGIHVASSVDDSGHAFAVACNLEPALEALGVSITAEPAG